MSKSQQKAEIIISSIEKGELIKDLKLRISNSESDWFKFSSKAYNILLLKEKSQRKKNEVKQNISCTTSKEIDEILLLNDKIADYALLLPIFSTTAEINYLKKLESELSLSESKIFGQIEKTTMHPKIRVLQKKGRFKQFEHFKQFTTIIDAATISYYRKNYISCYLTLVPVIEGIIIRWMGFENGNKKPDFEDIRKFFKKAPQRQPYPFNILFHNIYIKVCDKILNEHFYKPSMSKGGFYANFNRHIASHLLKNDDFATKNNCIRLFLLLDTMTEIYLYESRDKDPRFNLGAEDINDEIELLTSIIFDNSKNDIESKLLQNN